MNWRHVTYYTREGAIGAVRCTDVHLDETIAGLVEGKSQVLDIKEVTL